MKLSFSHMFSRREKLLIGLLGSSMVFSASFSPSYGAVDQTRVDTIMQAISNSARQYPTEEGKNKYYGDLYTGLSKGIELLTVIRDNVSALMSNPPTSVSPGNPGGTTNDGGGTTPSGSLGSLTSADISTMMKGCPAGSYYAGELLYNPTNERAKKMFSEGRWLIEKRDWFDSNTPNKPVSTGSYAVFTLTIPSLDWDEILNEPVYKNATSHYPDDDYYSLPSTVGVTPYGAREYVKGGNLLAEGNFQINITETPPCDFSRGMPFTILDRVFGDGGGGMMSFPVYKKGKKFVSTPLPRALYDNTRYYVTVRATPDEVGKYRVNTMFIPNNFPYTLPQTNNLPKDKVCGQLDAWPSCREDNVVYYNNLGGAYGIPALAFFGTNIECYYKDKTLRPPATGVYCHR